MWYSVLQCVLQGVLQDGAVREGSLQGVHCILVCVAACVAVRVADCRRVCTSVWYHLLQVVAVYFAVHVGARVASF